MIRLRVSEAAARSIVEQADYYTQQADRPLAVRWEAAVDEAVRSLLSLPERGASCRFRAAGLAGLRWLLVPGFPKHLVFYRYDHDRDSVLIVQVLHGSQDLEAVLFDEQDAE